MKKIIIDCLHRGLVGCGFGPIVLAILYLILQKQGLLETLTINQVCLGIFSLTGLAFIAGGTNVLYQIEQLPLMIAIFIHGGVLYISYLIVYLLNGWLQLGKLPILAFTGIFVLGYLLIWAIIYIITKRKTAHINQLLKEKQNKELM